MKKFIALFMIRLLLFIACADLIALEINSSQLPGGELYVVHNDKKAVLLVSEQKYL